MDIVDHDTKSDTYRVLIRRDQFVMDTLDERMWEKWYGSADTATITIPRDAVTHRADNPTGSNVLCYSVFRDWPFCFVPYEYQG